ncbi:MAG TPA: TetR/AcrR family transcriptional regulator [Pseudonocardiaceae bacterium]|nr:TetR/AcrR family transcriptional regulator [Pseudonocardiaceae bacterium]
MAAEPGAAREQLLGRCIGYLQQVGFSHLSLREIAAGVGTSHRMLIYHFGSRDGLFAQIAARIEGQQRALLAVLAQCEGSLADNCRTFWKMISDPSVAPTNRMFFEAYAHALHNRPWTASFRKSVLAAWDKPLTDLFHRHGFARAEAARRGRLTLAVAHGLLLDLLLADDRRTVNASAELFVQLVSATAPL